LASIASAASFADEVGSVGKADFTSNASLAGEAGIAGEASLASEREHRERSEHGLAKPAWPGEASLARRQPAWSDEVGFASEAKRSNTFLLSCVCEKRRNVPMHSSSLYLPHQRHNAYRLALQLLGAVRASNITDRKLKDEALRASKSACLNIAEALGRGTRADRARVYLIARAEAGEACAAVEIAVQSGEARAAALPRVIVLGGRLVASLTRMSR
jgi:four helix bundle protein